jgi:DNA-binding transcriptional MocR family regulator
MKRYQQIHHDIKQNILTKKLKQGQRLPSILTLSKTYQCSKGTVIKALDLLCQQHVIFSKPQSGYYVADSLIRAEENIKGYYLTTGNPVVNSLQTADIKHCLHLAAELYAKYSLDVTLRGIDSLNGILANYLANDGVYAKDDNIHLIQGITQILTFLTLAPFPNGKETILIEEPSYSYYVSYLTSINADVLTISRDEFGIDLQLLEAYFKNKEIKFFYTIPRNHNPLGTSYSYLQRKKIMELALKYDVYIVEDDYFGNTHKLSKYVPIHYFSYQKNCIYLRTFSKELPFIRVGIAVIPSSFSEIFEEISRQSYYYSYHMPDLISQATLEAYIQSSICEKHAMRINQSINRKLQLIKAITDAWDSNYVKLIGANSGYYFTLQLKPEINVNQLIGQLEMKHVFVTSNERAFYHQDDYDNSIRLSISQISLQHLNESLSIIYQTIEEIISSQS